MYDGKSQLLIRNPLDRYLIDSPMLPEMKKNADGSAHPLHSERQPRCRKGKQLLPAPHDLVYLVMRLYWSKTEPPSILPPGEGTWKPPGIVKANQLDRTQQ